MHSGGVRACHGLQGAAEPTCAAFARKTHPGLHDQAAAAAVQGSIPGGLAASDPVPAIGSFESVSCGLYPDQQCGDPAGTGDILADDGGGADCHCLGDERAPDSVCTGQRRRIFPCLSPHDAPLQAVRSEYPQLRTDVFCGD